MLMPMAIYPKRVNLLKLILILRGDLFHLSTKDFEEEILPNLKEKDTVIFSYIQSSSDENRLSQLSQRIQSKCSKAAILIGTSTMTFGMEEFDTVVNIILPKLDMIPNFPLLGEFSAKLIFNAITTGACIQKGKVFSNRMINLGVR